MSVIHDLPRGAQSAQPQQNANGADDARHDHRRRRRHHDGGARHRRAVVDRGADSDGWHQHDHRQAGNFTQGGVRQGQGNASTLTPDDAAEIAKLPGVQYAAAGRQHARTDGRRQPELEHAAAGHRRRLPAHPLVAGGRGRVLHVDRRDHGLEGGRHRQHRARPALRPRRRPGRPGHPRSRTSRSPSSASWPRRASRASVRIRTTWRSRRTRRS